MPESAPEQLHERQLREEHRDRSGVKQAAFYVAAGVTGIGSATNNLHHKYHSDVKGKTGFDKLYTKRKASQEGETAGKTNIFRNFVKIFDRSEQEYREAYGELLFKERGIHSGGWKGWTIGSWQRWRVSGPHTRREVLFNLGTTSIVTLGALMLMDRHHVNSSESRDDRLDPTPRTTVMPEAATVAALEGERESRGMATQSR